MTRHGGDCTWIAEAILGLYDVYKPEGVAIWLRGSNREFAEGTVPARRSLRRAVSREFVAAVERLRAGTAT